MNHQKKILPKNKHLKPQLFSFFYTNILFPMFKNKYVGL